MIKLNIQTPTARARLAPQGKPYKVRLLPGVWLGYRAAQSEINRIRIARPFAHRPQALDSGELVVQ